MRNHENNMDQENYRIFVARTIRELEDTAGIREAENLAWLTLEHVTGVPVMQLRVNAAVKLPKSQMQKAEKVVRSLKKNVPFQYITCQAPFYGAIFKVTPSVLIPRPETEELVHKAIATGKALIARQAIVPQVQGQPDSAGSRKDGPDPLQILDIGTGSGCIAVTLARELPHAEVHAVDISRRALSVAAFNARNQGVSVQFYQADILKPNPLREMGPGGLDIIVSNPPYVTVAQKEEMLPRVVEHEPHRALFVPDSDPLRFYRAIGRLGTRWLKPGGALLFEINETLASQTAGLLSELGYSEVSVIDDINGKARIVSALRPTLPAESE